MNGERERERGGREREERERGRGEREGGEREREGGERERGEQTWAMVVVMGSCNEIQRP